MKSGKNMVRIGAKAGAALGAVAFLVFGIIPGVYFGSYGTLILMDHLFVGPLQATAMVRVATALGILTGIACVGSVTITVGAILGTVIGYVTDAFTTATKEEMLSEEAQTEAKAK
ncbi:MAG TPA: hypothetical protein VJW95_00745 [Dissulfurispiraceae bacterium]|nr:hypothetical protein [Dissulfurispiraceae bacterium]